MKRVIYIDTELQKEKYILKEEYKDFGIYQRMTPSGLFVHQDWLLTDGNEILICKSFNHKCYEEILDMIDNHNSTNEFGVKGFDGKIEYVHPNGKINL